MMTIDRRQLLKSMSSIAGAAAAGGVTGSLSSSASAQSGRGIRKIGTEAACMVPEIARRLGHLANSVWDSLDRDFIHGLYGEGNIDNPTDDTLMRLLDLGDRGVRLADMDAGRCDMQVLSLTTPGVQMFDAELALEMTRVYNDTLAEAVRNNPGRFAALAAFAPQDVQGSIPEMERAINELGLNGFIINSHTANRYLDEREFWPLLEAAASLNAPIYIHPRAPSDGMAAPYRDLDLELAGWGFGMETGTHAVRLMLSGALDEFEDLTLVLGHMGEGVPWWLWRLDYWFEPNSESSERSNLMLPSEYMARNFMITTSGVEDSLALQYCIDKIGADRIMWAADYPYQDIGPASSWIEEAPITTAQREAICYRNAERIFNISSA